MIENALVCLHKPMNPENRERPREFTVRAATHQDAAAIARIQHESWLATYPSEELEISQEAILAYLGDITQREKRWEAIVEGDSDRSRVFLIEETGKVIGFCRVSRLENENHIDALYLDPQVKGTGAGGKVFQDAMAWLGDERNISLEVATHNASAIGFYERYGFSVEGDDAIVKIGDKDMPTLRMVKESAVKLDP